MESEWVTRAAEGDAEAFDSLVVAYQDRATLYAFALLGDRHLAEDAAQSAFFDAFRNLKQLKSPAAFAGWLRTIVFKHADRIQRKRKGTDLDAGPSEESNGATIEHESAGDPSAIAERKESIEVMLAAFRRLPVNEREIVGLYYGLDRSQKEIAEFLELPITTVNNRLASARKNLKQGMMNMLSEGLQAQNPSRDEKFIQRARAILKAAQDGNSQEVARLLGDDPSLVNVGDQFQKTALHLAAEHNRPEVAEILLAAGANPEAMTTWGMTPLEWAANMGRRDVAEKLIAAGAKINMWAAAGLGRLEDVQSYFSEDGSLRGGAAQTRNEKNDKGEWVAVPASKEPQEIISEAFYIACRNGHTAVARFLHSKGANINQLGFFRAPGLHWACMNGHRDTVAYLLSLGADCEIRDTQFHGNAMNWALETEQTAIQELLLQHGMTMTIGQASIAGRLDFVQQILADDPSKLDVFDGWGTPLHQAVLWGRGNVAKFLLDRGADRYLKNKDGETAVDLANRGVAGQYRPPNVAQRKEIWERMKESS